MTLWPSLVEELDRWSDAGKIATFWWRNDDAVDVTRQLERLLTYAESIPIALAVVPMRTTSDLAERLRSAMSVVVLQHGWAHLNHAGEGRSEYPASRSEREVGLELTAGQRVLEERFRHQAIGVFVPPWHAFDERFLPLLVRSGISCISSNGPRTRSADAGLLRVNTHVAPIQWTLPPSFGEEDEYVTAVIDHLKGRRTGRFDALEPTGLLTHHLVQDQRSYDFVMRLTSVTSEHTAAQWLSGRQVFAKAGSDDCAVKS